ncbi:response regulator [Pseudolysobacter antarcticus]|uniref:Response regulator n=1 Tax=Pseudolysobacter antarcticus TaxID=2511995 RepID=A0A411HIB2_9GAMM|nr:response regulator [Pseudolysobacter antarcticus]QBB70245.1 response regulator [Pseudolysobacter antarcticus]
MIRIVLVDDHALVRTGFRMILERQADIEIVGEAGDGESGLAMIKKLAPDVAIVDVHMPGISGVELTDRLRRSHSTTRVVILSMIEEAPFPRRLLDAGASGYLSKSCAADELLHAVREVASGRRYLAASIAQQLALERMSATQASPFDALSARELEVALMLASGKDMGEAALALNLSGKTVATYKYRLFAKLDVKNEVGLTHLALLHGLLDAGLRGAHAELIART